MFLSGILPKGETRMVNVRARRDGAGWRCEVAVDHAGRHTEHSVTVTEADLKRWGQGAEKRDVEDLVIRSFEFLLEREQADSILRSFDLSVIQRYFPEYDRLLGGGDRRQET
jgi:hypothetical protein